MADNIIDFTRRPERLLKQLDEKIEGFNALYAKADKLYGVLNRLQETIDREEVQYNMLLLEYANIVGLDNIPIEYAEYASNVSFFYDGDEATGKISFEFVGDLEGIDK
jgi:hypothetical protein